MRWASKSHKLKKEADLTIIISKNSRQREEGGRRVIIMKSTVGKAEEKRKYDGVKLSEVGKRGGVQSTPVKPFLTPNKQSKPPPRHDYNHYSSSVVDSQELRAFKDGPFRLVSARKLASLVWELYQYKLPLSGMYHGGGGGGDGGASLPRLRRHGLQQKDVSEVHYPMPRSSEMPESSSNLRNHASPMMQHRRTAERFNNAIQAVSPASYGSSMEIAPYNPAVTPTSSVELRNRTGEAGLSLRTSTELLKVLNRIWSLEEQHGSNMALVKALKKELDRARAQIKALLREQQADRQEINELMKQISEDKLARTNEEHHRIDAAINSMREELGNERKLRKRSEGLHRKLAHELQDVKVTLATVSKDLEDQGKAHHLLEDLCDEFAVGINKYGKELRALRQESDRDWAESSDYDRLLLHISESWLDERKQMKVDPSGRGFGGNNSAVVKLSSEIEAFLKAKTSINSYKLPRDPALRSSLESIPLNAVSAPRGEDNEDDDSACSDSNCFELEKMGEALLRSQANLYHEDETEKKKQPVINKRIGSSDRATGLSPSHLQVKFEEQMARAISHLENSNQARDDQGDLIQTVPSKTPEKREIRKEEGSSYEVEGIDANDMMENLSRNHYMLVQSEKLQPENKDYVAGHWKSQPSPIRQWTGKLSLSHGMMSESSSSKLPQELKENTLKSKLLEARTRGQRSRSRSRLKASATSSRNY